MPSSLAASIDVEQPVRGAAMGDPAMAPGGARGTVAFYTDAGAWPGGAEVYLTGLMRWLRDHAWRVSVFTSDRPATEPWTVLLGAEGFPVARFRPTHEVDARGAREAARLLRGFDVVHFNKTHPRTCLPAIRAAREAGARVVVSTEHVAEAPVSNYPLGALVVTWLVRTANRFVDRVVVVSEASRQAYVRNYRCPPGQVVTLRNGVDLARFAALPERADARRSLGLADGDAVAVVIGRLCEGKGQDAAISATALVRERVPAFRLLLVGDGPMAPMLRRLAEERGVAGAVVFAGFRDDVEAALSAADIFVLASEAESLPLSVLEAMAAGRPVVAADVGGLREAVEDGLTGALVPPADPGALARAISDVLSLPGRGAAMGAAGRRKAEAEFDASACFAGVAALYERLLAEAPHA